MKARSVHARLVKAADFKSAWLQSCLTALKHSQTLHRKNWEFASIINDLELTGMLQPGRRGLGFGVGQEKLPCFFAAAGCDVLATDLPASSDDVKHWAPSNQHAAEKSALFHEDFCSREAFAERVAFRPLDMNALPEDLHDQFDFIWSTSVFEHLGSIEKGLLFLLNSLKCLRPGGVAVHTTEFKLGSGLYTLDNGPIVTFTQRDLVPVLCDLAATTTIDLSIGTEPEDRLVDEAPYHDEPHLKLRLAGVTFTSIAITIIK